MNYQLTTQIPDYFNELDQMLFYLSLSGSAFKKIYFDDTLDRVCSKFVPAEDFVIAKNALFHSWAWAIAHQQGLIDGNQGNSSTGDFSGKVTLTT